MNIWKYLGLGKDLRKTDKITMKVKHLDEVPISKKYDDWYLAEIKKDGVFCHVVKKGEGDISLFSRTGKEFTCTDYLINQLVGFREELLPGVYMTELCCDECSLEALSGIFNPNRKKKLSDQQHTWCKDSYLAFHDFVPIDEFLDGVSTMNARDRYNDMVMCLPDELDIVPAKLVQGEQAIRDFAKLCIDLDEEGAVFKRCSSRWVAGHKGYRSMKIVRGVDFDLLCIGAEEGTGKYAEKVANLIFKWKDGKTVKCMLGKGWTHEDAQEMFDNWNLSNIHSPVGKIFQVYALDISSKGKLRLPKVGELRHDKEEPDV